jgi:hypothetical protein
MPTAQLVTPPLTAGDNLTRAEFLRRWQMNPGIKKAELIGGIVYMPSPVSWDHGVKDGYGGAWLVTYHAGTPGTDAGLNATTFLLDDIPQPDGFPRFVARRPGSAQGRHAARPGTSAGWH